jgi:hypothetical protein
MISYHLKCFPSISYKLLFFTFSFLSIKASSQINNFEYKTIKYLGREIRIPKIDGYMFLSESPYGNMSIAEITGTKQYEKELNLNHIEYLISNEDWISTIHVYGSTLNNVTFDEYIQYKIVQEKLIADKYYIKIAKNLFDNNENGSKFKITPEQKGYLELTNNDHIVSWMIFVRNKMDNEEDYKAVIINYVYFNKNIITIMMSNNSKSQFLDDKFLKAYRSFVSKFENINNLR